MSKENEEEQQQIGEMLSGSPSDEEESETQYVPLEEEQEEQEEPEGNEEPTQAETEEEETPSETQEEPEAEQTEEGESLEEEGEETQEPDEVEELRQQLNDAHKQINEMEKRLPSTEESEEETEGEEPQPEAEREEAQPRQFVTEEEHEQILDNPDKMNEVLNRVYVQGKEDVLRSLPNIVEKRVSSQVNMRRAADEFYQEHPELSEYKEFVGHVANKVQEENPDTPINEIFQETAKRAKEKLGIREEAESRESQRRESKQTDKKPAFAGKPRGNRQPPSDNRDPQQKGIDDMLNSVG